MENENNTSNFKIIPSVKEVKYLKKAIQSDNLCIQLTGVHIGNLQQLSHICHQAGKTVIVNHELVDGLGKDRIAFQMLKKLYHVEYYEITYDEGIKCQGDLSNYADGFYFCR